MSASADDFFHKVGRSTATTLSAPGYTIGDTSINVASTTNWPTSTGVTFAIDETDADGNRVSGTYNVFRGTVSGATQVNNLTYVGGDANRNYAAAATTRVYILVSAYRDNRFTDGILVEHNQDGTHEFSGAWKSWVPTQTGFSSVPPGGVYRYQKIGKTVHIAIRQPSFGTSNATTFTITLPYPAATVTSMIWTGHGYGIDNGGTAANSANIYITSAGTVMTIERNWTSAAWTASGSKRLAFGEITYEAAS